MFPFLLRVAPDVAVQNLRAFFKAQGFCLKQNTAFTLLKSQQVERSTFQVLSPGLQRKRGALTFPNWTVAWPTRNFLRRSLPTALSFRVQLMGTWRN